VKVCPTRERIKKHLKKNPEASLREIQRACAISSVSVVHFHLKQLEREPCPHCGRPMSVKVTP
jgi:predicted transcriptional regulator